MDGCIQNGTIVDALLMWKADADRLFEGIEPCAICYCVVHGTDRSVPRVACKTCKHKYHSHCLVWITHRPDAPARWLGAGPAR